ncbi:MAG TPA: NYN domain-containing protein [Allosphingosinicella sp.]|jgi:uncharacterized LabA/DUF88 family protein
MRVRIFVDHANFDIAWRHEVGSCGGDLAWEELPGVIMNHLSSINYLQRAEMELRGISVYASTRQPGRQEDRHFDHWLRFELDQLPGYTVKISPRQRRVERCDKGHESVHYVEKGVDTKIVCDMMALAMRDLYDVAVVISDDSDLVPSVECVQDVLDKHVVHVGFERSGAQIRSAAWSHLLLDNMISQMVQPPRLKAVPSAPA